MKKYSMFLLIWIGGLLLFVSALNWLINPYDVFSSPVLAGINEYKVDVDKHARLSKIYQIERVKPDVVFLASSRGISVPVDFFTNENEKGFNFSLPSASTFELLRMLQHAQQVNPLKRVVLALDEEFSDLTLVNYEDNRLLVNSDGSLNENSLTQRWQDYFASLLSLDALRSSVRTIKKQKKSPVNMGQHQYFSERVHNAGGHRQMFRTMEASLVNKYNKATGCPGAEVHDCAVDEVRQVFYRIVEFSYSNDIELVIYFSPVHARYYEILMRLGQQHNIEEMKRFVVESIEYLAGKYNKESFLIWDFSGYNEVTAEHVPEADNKQALMEWYWEGSHYTIATAELMFNKIGGQSECCETFGRRIDSTNIEYHLQRIRQTRDAYVRSHENTINELDELIQVNKSK